jgi:hypothetical protein
LDKLTIPCSFMSDREILEKAEARVLVPSYYATVEKVGKQEAALWLIRRIRDIEKHYGYGFERRIRAYMREIDNEELFND